MCTNNFILVLLFIIKILIILIPISIFVLKRIHIIDNIIEKLYMIEVIFLVILIILCIFGKDCIKNSSVSGIKLNNKMFSDVDYIDEKEAVIDFSEINPTKIYTGYNNMKVNYYNINYYPLSDIKIYCDKKSYLENYGNDISALATGISAITGYTINPNDILEYVFKNNKIDCNKKISTIDLISFSSDIYGINYRRITESEILSSIRNNKIVLGVTNTNNKENLSCGNNLVVIYTYNEKGSYNILNPSDKYNSYFCPSNTSGYGSIVIGDQNNTPFEYDTLTSYLSDYYVLEVR